MLNNKRKYFFNVFCNVSQAFSLKALQLLDYNAYIKVTKINRTDIPNNCKEERVNTKREVGL